MIATMESCSIPILRIAVVLMICTMTTHSPGQERGIALSFLQAQPQERTVSPGALRHFRAAQAAEARLDLQAAASEYEEATRIEPGWAEAFVNLGIVYNRQSNADKAIAAFTRAAEINPRLTGAQLNLAITHFRARRFSEAEMPLRRALEIDPSNDQAEALLVLSLFALDRYTEVVDLGEKRVARTADAATVEILGRAYLKLRRYDQAVRTLQFRARLQPVTAETYFLLGEALDNAGDSEGAIGEFNRAIAMAGDSAPAELHFALGYVLWKLRRYDEAEVAFRHELERDRNHSRSTYYLGNIALSRGDWKNAVRLLEQAAAAIPQDFASRYDLAKALIQLKEAGRAVDEARAAIALNPGHAGAHYQLGLAYRQLKQEEDAQREFALARELNKAERESLEQKVQGEERKKKP